MHWGHICHVRQMPQEKAPRLGKGVLLHWALLFCKLQRTLIGNAVILFPFAPIPTPIFPNRLSLAETSTLSSLCLSASEASAYERSMLSTLAVPKPKLGNLG